MISERNQARACQRRVDALGARAPTWVNPGGSGICAAESRDQALTLVRVLESNPDIERVRVRVVPGLVGRSAQVELGSGDILAPPGDEALRDSAVWLHELAHVQAMGRRPEEPIAQRLVRAVEEGAADYYAASLTGSTTLGVVEGRAQRDLSLGVTLQPTDWAALALGAADPHRFGWSLASELWRSLGAEPTVARDLLRGLSELQPESRRGARVLAALVAAVPERSRRTIDAALQRWLPNELQAFARVENTN